MQTSVEIAPFGKQTLGMLYWFLKIIILVVKRENKQIKA